MRFWISISLLVISLNGLLAQNDTVSSKFRFAILGGTSFSPPIWNNRVSKDPMKIQFEWIVLPPPLELAFMVTPSNRSSVSFMLNYRGIQNSSFHYDYYDPAGDPYQKDKYVLKTNTWRFSSDYHHYFSSFQSSYLGFGAGLTVAESEVFSWQEYFKNNGYGEVKESIEINENGFYRTFVPHVSIGIGHRVLKNHGSIWDYGMRTSIHFGKRNYGYDYSTDFSSFDYFEQLDKIIDRTINSNLNASYAFELYIKVGSFFR